MTTWMAILFLFLATTASAAQHFESHYQTIWCNERNGQIEYRLPDKTRCDCLTNTHAVEVEFSQKWAEGIGQALYYSLQTGKRAGIVLILETKADRRHWIRLNSTIQHFNLPIDTWKISP